MTSTPPPKPQPPPPLKASPGVTPSPGEYNYPGTANLELIEDALTNYNHWIVGKFIKVFRQRAKAKARVLDFGAGIGTLSKIFLEETGVRPDAFDIDPSHRAQVAAAGFRTYGSVADLEEGYALIFSSNVLEHVEDDVGTLKSMWPYLRKDGTLLIYVPAFHFLWTPMDDFVQHVRRYEKADLIQKVEKAGYVVEQIRYCDSVGFLLSLIFKRIGRKNGQMPLKSLAFYDKFLLPVSKLLDRVAAPFFGKNLYLIARKPN